MKRKFIVAITTSQTYEPGFGTDSVEEQLVSTYATSEKEALRNIRYRHGMKQNNEVFCEGQYGYVRRVALRVKEVL